MQRIGRQIDAAARRGRGARASSPATSPFCSMRASPGFGRARGARSASSWWACFATPRRPTPPRSAASSRPGHYRGRDAGRPSRATARQGRRPISTSPWLTAGRRSRASLPTGRPVMSVSFIPSEKTRSRARGGRSRLARIGILSVFPEFLALMKPGVLRFTPACPAASDAALLDDPDLAAVPPARRRGRLRDGRRAGAPAIARRSAEAIEYRHVPDPHAVQRRTAADSSKRRSGAGDCRTQGRSQMKISDMNWMQVEEYLQRDDRAVLPLGIDRAARPLSPLGRFHPLRARRGRSGRAARRAGFPGACRTASRPISWPSRARCRCASRRYLARDPRHPGRLGAGTGSAASCSSTAMAATRPPQPLAQEWMADHPGAAIKLPQLVERAARPWPRCRRSTRSPPMPPGWRTSPGRGCPTSRCRDAAEADDRPRAACALSTRRGARACSATAISAGFTSAPTRTCWRSGRSRVEETRALHRGAVAVSGTQAPIRSSSGARAPSAARSGAISARAGHRP